MTMGLIGKLRTDLSSLRVELAFVRALLELKYNPDQPRVPAGSAEGGQWSSDGGSLIDAANRRVPFQRVDLQQEEMNGGHAIEKHVAVPSNVLTARLEGERLDMPDATIFWSREGSFDSVGSANSYVNDILTSNPAEVQAVADGSTSEQWLEKRYDSPTGREAYRLADDPDGVVRMRRTFSVGVYIQHSNRKNGFTVITACPLNSDRRK